MSMSTSIDDLPGPQQEPEVDYETTYENQNIVPLIKKKVRFADEETYFNKFKNELTEENLLILGFIIIATLPNTNGYISQIPFIGQYATTDFITHILKAVILFVIYILSKLFILPLIKL